MKKLFTIVLLLTFYTTSFAYAEGTYFMDLSRVMNESIAGKDAKKILNNKLTSGKTKYSKIEKDLLNQERDIISKKKILSKEEYQSTVGELRKKVAKFQQDKRKNLTSIDKLRIDSRNALIKSLNPILKKYMEAKKISIVVDKRDILLGDSNLDITSDILKLLNKEIKKLNLK